MKNEDFEEEGTDMTKYVWISWSIILGEVLFIVLAVVMIWSLIK